MGRNVIRRMVPLVLISMLAACQPQMGAVPPLEPALKPESGAARKGPTYHVQAIYVARDQFTGYTGYCLAPVGSVALTTENHVEGYYVYDRNPDGSWGQMYELIKCGDPYFESGGGVSEPGASPTSPIGGGGNGEPPAPSPSAESSAEPSPAPTPVPSAVPTPQPSPEATPSALPPYTIRYQLDTNCTIVEESQSGYRVQALQDNGADCPPRSLTVEEYKQLEEILKSGGVDVRANTLQVLDHPVTRVAMVFVPLTGQAKGLEAAQRVFQVVQNYKKGMAAEQRVVQPLLDLGIALKRQVTIRAKDVKDLNFKKDRRIDIETDVEIIEVKDVAFLEKRSQLVDLQKYAKLREKAFVIYTNGKIHPRVQEWLDDLGIITRPIP